jgi:hypothetical protein
MMQDLGPCGIAVLRALFESMQLQQFSKGAGITSVRAGYRQVIDVAIVPPKNSVRLMADVIPANASKPRRLNQHAGMLQPVS